MLVGGKSGGALQIVWGDGFFWGSGEILVGSSSTDMVTPAGVAFLLEGPRVYPFPTPLCVPGETLGLVSAAAASSSFSFLKMFLGTRRLSERGRNSPDGATVAGRLCSLICRCRHLFLFSFSRFSFGLGCVAAPAKLVVSCGCYINIAGQKSVS
jgi:hypothetical protein